MKTLTYSGLCQYQTLEDRFEYLKLSGQVGRETFGYDRYINQKFYRSAEWKNVRQQVLIRDGGCNLAVPGLEIPEEPVVHHMNPITVKLILDRDDLVMIMDFLITTDHRTHNAIHYGDANQLQREFVARRPGDTKLW